MSLRKHAVTRIPPTYIYRAAEIIPKKPTGVYIK